MFTQKYKLELPFLILFVLLLLACGAGLFALMGM